MNWDEYYMGIAMHVANKSKDPSTRVGAVLVDTDNRVVSTGYNGLPRGVPDDPVILADRARKLKMVLHAEDNALLFARRDVRGATAYVWPMPPCSHCAARLIQAGVTRIVAPIPTPDQMQRWGDDWGLADWMYSCADCTLDYMEEL